MNSFTVMLLGQIFASETKLKYWRGISSLKETKFRLLLSLFSDLSFTHLIACAKARVDLHELRWPIMSDVSVDGLNGVTYNDRIKFVLTLFFVGISSGAAELDLEVEERILVACFRGRCLKGLISGFFVIFPRCRFTGRLKLSSFEYNGEPRRLRIGRTPTSVRSM